MKGFGPTRLRRRTIRVAPLALAAVFGVSVAWAAPSAVTDINPGPTPAAPFGGRVEAVTVDPINPLKMFAASELGGIFRSLDGGATWVHVDEVPLTVATDVEIAASDSNLVIATGSYDGRVNSLGGVWRSTDGGVTWAKPAGSDPTCTSEPGAEAVAIAPGSPGALRVYVADTCGLSISPDSGATWTHRDVAGQGNAMRLMWDVQARQDGANIQVDTCGVAGFFRSDDGGTGWTAFDPASPMASPAFGPCTVDVAPQDSDIVFLSNWSGVTPSGFCASQLSVSTAGGAAGSWTAMDPTDANCRDPFVQTRMSDAHPTHFDVYFGTSVRVVKQHCDTALADPCTAAAIAWTNASNGAHSDPADFAFDPASATGCPILLATDGGISRTNDCGANWFDSSVGLHAWDLRGGMAGTVYPAKTELYFATQDNGFYWTDDDGATYNRAGPDGYAVFADHNPPARVLDRTCFGCSINISGPLFSGKAGFSLPPGDDVPNNFIATQFGPRSYAFVTPTADATPIWRVYVTTDEGGTWNQMGPDLPGRPRGGSLKPTDIQASGPAASPTFYLRLDNAGSRRMYRLSGPFDSTATLTPINTGLSSPREFAVDPVDPTRLYAVDTGTQAMMRSTNGGASWVADTTLTSLVTNAGEFKFDSSNGPVVSALAFDGNSDQVFVGTRTGGLFASVNNGANWIAVRGSELLPRPKEFFFDERLGVTYVGTRGRGLWSITLPEADLRITKSSAPDPVIAGEQLFYTVAVTNDGPDVASGVVVTDTLPHQVAFVASNGSCVEAPAGTVKCDLGELAPGASKAIQIKVAVDENAVSAAGAPLYITNVASVAASETLDTNPANNQASETTLVEDLADLQVTKLCKPDTVIRAGETVRCSVFVDNHGPSDARTVIVRDTILSDGNVTVSNVSAGPGNSCGSVTSVTGGKRFECQLGVVAAATGSETGRETVTYEFSTNDEHDVNNVADVRSNTPDPDASNNSDQLSLSVTGVADLSAVKTGPASVVAGETGVWTITLTNDGPSIAHAAVVEDWVPAGTSVVSVSGTSATCTAGVPGDPARPSACAFGSLPSGASRTMTVTLRVLPETTGTLHNDTRAASTTFDDDASNNLDTVSFEVPTRADLSVTQLDSPDPATAGRPMTIELRVRNDGPSRARAVQVDDVLPLGVRFDSVSVAGGAGTCSLAVGLPNEVRCALGDLDPGATRSVFLQLTPRPEVPHLTVLTNEAAVGSSTTDTNAGNNTSSADTTAHRAPDLSLVHTASAHIYQPSSTHQWRIAVTNLGPSNAANVVITEQLPSTPGSYVHDTGGCSLAGLVLTCNVPGELAPGETKTIEVDWYIQGGSAKEVCMTASVSTTDPDSFAANDSATRCLFKK